MDETGRLTRLIPQEKYEFTASGGTIRYDNGQVLDFEWDDLYSSMVLWFPVLSKRSEVLVNAVLVPALMNLATLGRYHGSWGVQVVLPFRRLDTRRNDLLAQRPPYVRVPTLTARWLIAAATEAFSGAGIVTLDDPLLWERVRALCGGRVSHFSRTHALMVSMPELAGVTLPTSAETPNGEVVAAFSSRSLQIRVMDRGVQVEVAGRVPVHLSWDYLDSEVWIRGAKHPDALTAPRKLRKLLRPPGDFLDFPVWFKVFVYFRTVDMPGWCALDVGRLGIRDSLKLRKFATWLAVYSAEQVAQK